MYTIISEVNISNNIYRSLGCFHITESNYYEETTVVISFLMKYKVNVLQNCIKYLHNQIRKQVLM